MKSPSDDDRTNPKDLVGRAKVDLGLFPPAGMIHGAHAFRDGAAKYGAYNWRLKAVRSTVYISAAQRHLASYLDGEDLAADSGVHHLGHAIACLAIILDAFEAGSLIDDRPTPGAASAILARLNAAIVAREAAKAEADRVNQSWADAATRLQPAPASDPEPWEAAEPPLVPFECAICANGEMQCVCHGRAAEPEPAAPEPFICREDGKPCASEWCVKHRQCGQMPEGGRP